MPLIHHWHPASLHYLGTSEADESPLEPGVYLIPAYATVVAPPDPSSVPSDHELKWDAVGNTWVSEPRPLPVIPEEPEPTPPLDAMTQLRNHRNGLLSQYDWVAIKYFTRGEAFPQDWANYFQALRDLPVNSMPVLRDDGLLDIASVEWPVPPTSG